MPTRHPPRPKPFTKRLTTAWRHAYRHGDCHILTTAIASALSLPTAYRCDSKRHGPGLHSCVQLPNGAALDAGGIVTIESLRTVYRLPGLRLVSVPTEAIAALAGPDDEEIVMALEVAARLPGIPQRDELWAARWRLFGDLACPWDPAEGPADWGDDWEL